jgi:hypothetical protein
LHSLPIFQVGVPRTNNSVSSLRPADEVEREQIERCSKPEFDFIFQDAAARINHAVSSLSLWERARVRAAHLTPLTYQD